MTTTIFIAIIIIHWFADYLFQAEDWAINKWHSFQALTDHTLTYTTIWFLPILYLSGYNLLGTIIFSAITFVTHTLVDFVTSKVVHDKMEAKELGSNIPNFGAFSIIGVDQVIHYIQLILTYKLLFT